MEKALVVIGLNLLQNSSVSLANAAYIQGLIDNGIQTVVIMPECDEADKDRSLSIPQDASFHIFERTSPFEKKIASRVKVDAFTQNEDFVSSIKRKARKYLSGLKQKIIVKGKNSLYANYVYLIDQIKNKWDITDIHFDYLITISSPVASHYIGECIKTERLATFTKWIQIWEDPWYYDLYTSKEDSILSEERRLLDLADRIVYVSPLTFQYQRKYFSDNSKKMTWSFLPCFKETLYEKKPVSAITTIGYFGEYVSSVRNIMPLVEAVESLDNVKLVLCGNTDLSLTDYDHIEAHGRSSLDVVEEYQNKSDILVNLSNLHGGQIPGKVYQYAGTNKTILFILDGTDEEIDSLYNIFSSYNRFIFCQNNVEDIRKALKGYISGEIRTVNEPVKDFCPYNVVKKILEVSNND